MRTVMRSAVPDVPGDVSRDGQLVTLARQGDEQAVRVLVRRYNQQLFRVARGVVHDDGEAEDIVQAAYVRAFTSLDGYRGEASFSTRSEERRVVKECVSTCRSRWSPYH